MLLLSPACPRPTRGSRLYRRVLCLPRGRGPVLALLGLAPCPRGSTGSPGRARAEQRLLLALRLHPVSPPPAQRRTANSHAPAVVLCLGLAGEAVPVGRWEVSSGFPVWEFGCVAGTQAPARRLGGPSPFTLRRLPRCLGCRLPQSQRAAAAASPVSTQLHDGRRAPRLKNIHPELPLFHLNSLQLS